MCLVQRCRKLAGAPLPACSFRAVVALGFTNPSIQSQLHHLSARDKAPCAPDTPVRHVPLADRRDHRHSATERRPHPLPAPAGDDSDRDSDTAHPHDGAGSLPSVVENSQPAAADGSSGSAFLTRLHPPNVPTPHRPRASTRSVSSIPHLMRCRRKPVFSCPRSASILHLIAEPILPESTTEDRS